MDFEWTQQHKDFRKRVGEVVDGALPANWAEVSKGLDNGSDGAVEFSWEFCPKLAEEGLLIPHWSEEDGGKGLDPFHHWILNEEMWSRGEPRAYQYMSVNWVGPAIIRFGSPEQKAYHLPKICDGSIAYCQGFSEPGAGSDLAGLTTKAERIPGGYRINGQKIWTSAASFAHYCVLLARTGEAGSKGISVFLVPMNAKGITVRVIPGLQGQRSLHEVFFDDVEVVDSDMLGEENAGWNVVRQILKNERVGAPRYTLTWRGFRRALEYLRANGKLDDPIIKARAARCEASVRAARLLALVIINERVKGRELDARTSVSRYGAAPAEKMISEFLAEFCPELLFTGGTGDPVVAGAYKRSASYTIAAGTAEVQLDLIARQVLGLPSFR